MKYEKWTVAPPDPAALAALEEAGISPLLAAVLSARGVRELDLEPVTVLYGGNGSGKTTALNVMADALRLQRGAQYNRSDFFPDYVSLCQFHTLHAIPAGSLILTSDDVFDYMLDLRALNDGVDMRREQMFADYNSLRCEKFQMHGMQDYDPVSYTHLTLPTT